MCLCNIYIFDELQASNWNWNWTYMFSLDWRIRSVWMFDHIFGVSHETWSIAASCFFGSFAMGKSEPRLGYLPETLASTHWKELYLVSTSFSFCINCCDFGPLGVNGKPLKVLHGFCQSLILTYIGKQDDLSHQESCAPNSTEAPIKSQR